MLTRINLDFCVLTMAITTTTPSLIFLPCPVIWYYWKNTIIFQEVKQKGYKCCKYNIVLYFKQIMYCIYFGKSLNVLYF